MKKMNLPNKLTIMRFVMALIVIVIFVLPYEQMGWTPTMIPTTGFNVIDLICCVLFIVASITDTLDGQIARKRNLITNFGKFMDPLADKFLVNSSLILLAVKNGRYLPAIIVVLMLGRDLVVDGIRLVAASQGKVIAANAYGKAKTIAQMIVIPILFLKGFPFNYLLKDYTYIFTIVISCIALVLSLVSGAIYVYRGREFIFDKDEKKDE